MKEKFDKKIGEALRFLCLHIDPKACFHLFTKDKSLGPIKEKINLPKFQVTMQTYFSIPNPAAFSPFPQDGRQVIKGSGIMGFQGDLQVCLEEADRDLCMFNCNIFYKICQEVDIIVKVILLGVPESIDEKQIQTTMDKELQELEQDKKNDHMLSVTRYDARTWIKYAITKEYPPGMPWEGIKEKKQKQGTSGERMAFMLHLYQPDYERMKNLVLFTIPTPAIWPALVWCRH